MLAAWAWPATTSAEESPAELRRRIENMSPEEKEQLRQRQDRFKILAPAEQQRILKLHEALEHDPNGAQLRGLMQRYYEWLKTLPSYRRAELLALDPKERVERVKQIYEEQARINARRLSPKDTEGLLQWMEDYAAKRESRFLGTVSEQTQEQLKKMDPPARSRAVMWWSWQRWLMGGHGRLPQLDESDLAELRSRLSPETRERLEALSPAEQRKTIVAWIQEESRNRWGSRRTPGKPSPIDEEELVSFFEDELSDPERDRLMTLPGDEMQRELRKMYLMRHRPEPPPRPGEGPGHFRGPPPPYGDRPYFRGPEKEPPEPPPGLPPPPPGAKPFPAEAPADAPRAAEHDSPAPPAAAEKTPLHGDT
jgi:hypothetical protein